MFALSIRFFSIGKVLYRVRSRQFDQQRERLRDRRAKAEKGKKRNRDCGFHPSEWVNECICIRLQKHFFQFRAFARKNILFQPFFIYLRLNRSIFWYYFDGLIFDVWLKIKIHEICIKEDVKFSSRISFLSFMRAFQRRFRLRKPRKSSNPFKISNGEKRGKQLRSVCPTGPTWRLKSYT